MAADSEKTDGLRLVCHSGEIVARPGDRFTMTGAEWEIVRFDASQRTYSAAALTGAPSVFCRCLNDVPMGLRQYADTDRVIEFCGDSVAAMLLARQDGRPRSSRGDLLNV